MVYYKPFIKIIDILLLIVRFVISLDQTIIQVIRKNKSILLFLINSKLFHRDVSKTIPSSKMRVFLILLV